MPFLLYLLIWQLTLHIWTTLLCRHLAWELARCNTVDAYSHFLELGTHQAFMNRSPDDKFKPAEIWYCLQTHCGEPQKVVDDIDDWVKVELSTKEQRKNVPAVDLAL